jgi:hypothetical protein
MLKSANLKGTREVVRKMKCESLMKNGERCDTDAPTGKTICVFDGRARAAEGSVANRAGGFR